MYDQKSNHKRLKVAILISDKTFQDKEACFVMLKSTIHQKDITIKNKHISNDRSKEKTNRSREKLTIQSLGVEISIHHSQ